MMQLFSFAGAAGAGSAQPAAVSPPPPPPPPSDPEPEPEPEAAPARPTLALTEEQHGIVESIKTWYREQPSQQCLTLGGYAGTGKTTLVKHLVSDGFARIRVVTPTGKAAHVLRKKGVDATTIHSFRYNCLGKDDDGELIFERKATEQPSLLISDESSMVPMPVFEDLVATGIRILWVGDHGQLEPVGLDAGLMRDPALKLETILRQAHDSPILSFAHRCRIGGAPVAIDTPELVVDRVNGVDAGRADTAWLLGFDQILVAFNRTRTFLNMQMRNARGFKGILEEGEKIICLRNDRRRALFNGMIVTVTKVRRLLPDIVEADVVTDDGRAIPELQIWRDQFNKYKPLDAPKTVSLFDYGYAITCHKSQGSEWDRVLVIEEWCDKWSMARWRYTAITRAARELVYLSNDVVHGSSARFLSAEAEAEW